MDAEGHPESNGFVVVGVPTSPFTRRSKSTSASLDPPLLGKADVAPNDIKSSLPLALDPLAPPSSCSFLVCSDSTREERLLMRSIKDWNCSRLSKGPRLILHKTVEIRVVSNLLYENILGKIG